MQRVELLVEVLPHGAGVGLPQRHSPDAAGLDLRAAVADELVIGPGETALVPTGLRVAVPRGYEAQVRPRSGLALRHGLIVPNSPGTIDADYRGEVQVILHNLGPEPFVVRRADRIAQMVIAPVVQAEVRQVEALEETGRGEGGFGHTGRR